MATPTFDVIAAGHICLDMFPAFTNEPGRKIADLLRPGTLVKVGAMSFSTGGAVSNVGIAMKIFGCKVGFVAKVGRDDIGAIITGILKKNGNAQGISIAAEEGSSYTVVVAPVGIDRIFLHNPGTNDTFTANDINFSIVEHARLFHLGYPTLMRSLFINDGKELTIIFNNVKQLGVTTSLDISLPDPASEAGNADWRAIFTRALPFTDIFVPSIEEAYFALHPEDYLARKKSAGGDELIDRFSPDEYSALAREFLELGCRMIALKAGHNGWYFRTAGKKSLEKMGALTPADLDNWADREVWCPAFTIDKIASATGSGDSSIAAFLTALLKNLPLDQCLKRANCAGCMNLSAVDALSGLQGWETMPSLIRSLAVRDIPSLHKSGWRRDEKTKIWEKK